MNEGKFVVFEGADGSGTSTQTRLMLKRLDDMYDKSEKTSLHIGTFEPSNGPIGKLARQVIEKKIKMDPKSLEMLFRADRTDHIRREMQPTIEDGIDVLCDRYYVSTLVYQSVRDTMEESIAAMWKLNRDMFYSENCDLILHPDVIIILYVENSEMEKRRNKRGSTLELFESSSYQEKVSLLYRYWRNSVPLADAKSKKIYVNGNKSSSDVAKDCWSAVKYLFQQNKTD